MPEQAALREALQDLVADVHAGDGLRWRIGRPAYRHRALLLAAAALVLVALVSAALALIHDEDATPVVTVPGAGWTSLASAPFGPREGAAVAWTGSELLAWGGAYGARAVVNEGAIYDPDADRWRPMADAPIEGRFDAVSAWTGNELLVWGGSSGTVWPAKGGAAYDPATDRWRTLTASPLGDREGATGVWTGHELVVWGGSDTAGFQDDGAAYDPRTDRWHTIAGAPISGRVRAYGAWTGDSVLVHGGTVNGPSAAVDGALYDPATDRWQRLPDSPVAGRIEPAEVWTGHELAVWGGFLPSGDTYSLDTWQDGGAVLDPASGTWRPTSAAPSGQRSHTYRGDDAVAVGDAVAFWPAGLLYRPASDRWETLPPSGLDAGGPAALAGVGRRLYVWAIGPVPGVAANDFPAMRDQRARGASLAVVPGSAPSTAPAATGCGLIHDLTPTYLPDVLVGQAPTSGPDVPYRWSGSPDAYVELRTDAPADGPRVGDAIRFLDGQALLGAVDAGLGIATPCGYRLVGHGIDRTELRRFAEGLVHGRQPFAIWPEPMALGLNISKLDTMAWRLDPTTTATRFATEVLGWPEVVVDHAQTSSTGAGASVDLSRRGHDEVVRIGLQPKVGRRWWSVTAVNIGETDPDASIHISANRADIILDVAPYGLAFATAEVRLHLGVDERSGDRRQPTYTFRDGPPLALDAPGWVLILLKDASGKAVTAWGRSLPAGPYSVG